MPKYKIEYVMEFMDIQGATGGASYMLEEMDFHAESVNITAVEDETIRTFGDPSAVESSPRLVEKLLKPSEPHLTEGDMDFLTGLWGRK